MGSKYVVVLDVGIKFIVSGILIDLDNIILMLNFDFLLGLGNWIKFVLRFNGNCSFCFVLFLRIFLYCIIWYFL